MEPPEIPEHNGTLHKLAETLLPMLLPALEKKFKSPIVYKGTGGKQFTEEQVEQLKTMLTLAKWFTGILGATIVASVSLLVTSIFAYSDLQHLKTDVVKDNQQKQADISEQKEAIKAVAKDASDIRKSQDQILPKIDQMTSAFNNANRRRAYDSSHPSPYDGNN